MVTDILYHIKKIPMGVVMSGTEESNEHYKEYIPDSFIYGQYEPEVIKKVITNQQNVVKKLSTLQKEDFTDPDPILPSESVLVTVTMLFLTFAAVSSFGES